MASSAEIRNWIITLVILGGGLWLLVRIGAGFIQGAASPDLPIDTSLVTGAESLGTLILMGVGALEALLVLYYLLKRSDEGQQRRMQQPQKQ